MSEINPLTQEFIHCVCQTFQANHPVIQEILTEQAYLQSFFQFVELGLKLTPPTPGSDPTQIINALQRLQSYFGKTSGVLGVIDGLSLSVNAIMQEHIEDKS